MPTFEGSLQIAGDSGTKMPAGIRVDGGRLTILAGPSDEIGSWALAGLDIHRKSGAFVLNVEGEQLLISVDDPDSFVRLVDVNEDAAPAPPPQKERRARKQKKERPPKEPRVKKSRKIKAPAVPVPEPEAAPPAVEPEPAPSYLVEPEPVVEPPPPPAVEEKTASTPKKQRSAKPKKAAVKKAAVKKTSLFAALPLSWKVGALLVALAIVLGIFFPTILTAILMLTGMLTLLLAVMVGSDSIIAARLPSGLTSNNMLATGVILLVLSALMMVVS
jgi:hypothetical protein